MANAYDLNSDAERTLLVAADGSVLASLAASDGRSNTELGQVEDARLYGFNGTTWDRLRTKGTGWQGVSIVRSSDGAELLTNVTAGDGDGAVGGPVVSVRNQLFNGTTWDRRRGNTEGTLLPSAARTATTSSAVQTNHNARGVVVWLDVTAASGTGGLTVQIRDVDPISGGSAVILASVPVIAVSRLRYIVYPGASAGATMATSSALGRTWLVSVVHGDGSNYTYSASYGLIV